MKILMDWGIVVNCAAKLKKEKKTKNIQDISLFTVSI